MAKFPNPFKVREHGNVEFWVSNLVIIASTVLGVYLASQAGFKTALQFELARSEREGYFMRRALLDELKDNIETSNKFSDYIINQDGWRFRGNAAKLQTYVWETMKEQSITFQLPADVLTNVRRFYNTVDALSKSMEAGQGTAIDAAKGLAEEAKKTQATVVPLLEKDIAGLRGKLVARGVPLD